MKTAYDIRLYGNDPKVLDGNWRHSFLGTNVEGSPKGKKGPPDAALMRRLPVWTLLEKGAM